MHKDDDTRLRLILEMTAMDTCRNDDNPVQPALRAWERLSEHLCPLIGEAGFCALYGRAARLAAARQLPPSPASQALDILLSTLRDNLDAMRAADAARVNIALLDTFTTLLSGIIGEALTVRLLATAWAVAPGEKHNE